VGVVRYIQENAVRRLIKFDGSCCLSCHEDMDDYDYPMLFVDFGKDREAEVCCAVHKAYEGWLNGKPPAG